MKTGDQVRSDVQALLDAVAPIITKWHEKTGLIPDIEVTTARHMTAGEWDHTVITGIMVRVRPEQET